MADDDSADARWIQIWRTNERHENGDTFLGEVLPRFATTRSELRNCTINHLENEEIDLALTRHNMRSILTACRSERCLLADSEDACMCRYKINTCVSGATMVVYQQGWHLMGDLQTASPPRPHLTRPMRGLLTSSLENNPTATAIQLFGLIAYRVEMGDLPGPPPTQPQVTHFLANWRRSHSTDATDRVMQLVNGALYDEVGMSAEEPRSTVFFSDSIRLDENVIPRIGVGTEVEPFRVGVSCYQLLHDYLKVQRDPSTTTMLHVDTTFNTVRQRYPVSVVGYSDKGGHFFPIAYFCTSRRKEADVSWCLRALKTAARRTFGEDFQPSFVMMDGDNAQYNACSADLPSTTILMCWFHVLTNVFKKCKAKGVEPRQTAQFFADLYDLHFAPRSMFETPKLRVSEKWSEFTPGSAASDVALYIKSSWLNSARFGKWQAFHTPLGCCTTNNPLEQYHRTLKRFCSNPKATPSDLLEMMDMARVAFLAKELVFSNTAEVSVRLFKLYKELSAHRCIFTTRMPSVGGLPSAKYVVRQIDLSSTSDTRQERLKSIGSVNIRRIQREGMPVSGWIVDTEDGSCDCLYHAKHGVCVHIVSAATSAGLPLPGLAAPSRRFIANIQRCRRMRRAHATTQPTEIVTENEVAGSEADTVTPQSSAVGLQAADSNEQDETSSTSDTQTSTTFVTVEVVAAEVAMELPVSRTEGTTTEAMRTASNASAPADVRASVLAVSRAQGTTTANSRRSGRQRRLTQRAAESAEQSKKRRR